MDAKPDQPYWKLCEEKAPAAAQAILDSWNRTHPLANHFHWTEFDPEYVPSPSDSTKGGRKDDECYRIWDQKLTIAMLNLLAEKVKTDGR